MADSHVTSLASAARECWSAGTRLAEMGKQLAPQLRASIRRALLQSVLHCIDAVSGD